MWGQAQKVGQAAPRPTPSYLSLSLLFVFFSARARVVLCFAELGDLAKLADRRPPRIHHLPPPLYAGVQARAAPNLLYRFWGCRLSPLACMASPLTHRATPQPQFWVLLLPLSPLGEGRDVPETLKLHFGGTGAGPGPPLKSHYTWSETSVLATALAGTDEAPSTELLMVVRLQH